MALCIIYSIQMIIAVIRIDYVCNERNKVMDRMFEICHKEVQSGNYDYQWRFDYFRNGPTIRQMTHQWWKPIKSFFPPVEDWKKPE